MISQDIIDSFVLAIGEANVVTDTAVLADTAKTNYKTTQRIPLILRPANAEEVSSCLKIANEHQLPVYPVSMGKNWGYGSKVPVKDDSIVIELERLKQISDYNEKLGYITVEPGVTFQQAFEFLRAKSSALILSTTGGGIDSSVMGNALDRGIGTGLYADRFSNVCGLQVILADGSIVNTGFKRFGNTAAGNVYKWGMGPSLDGLFSQSNFGVVTKLTVWLMPCPELLQLVFYKINDSAKITPVIDVLQDLAMNGVVRPTITMYNDFRVFATMVQYPWAQCDPEKNTPSDVIDSIRSASDLSKFVGAWNGEISIRSVSKEHGQLQYELIRSRIADYVDDISVVEVSKTEILTLLEDHYKGNFGGHDKDLIKSFLVRKYIGIPDNTAIKQTYWRKKTPIPAIMNPDTDGCGMIWMCPIVPFDSSHIENAVNIILRIIEKYRFEPAVSLQCMSERAINIIASICWDRDVAGEDERAEKCYKEVNEILNENGYFAYRNTTLGMLQKKQSGENDDYHTFVHNIKKAVDPNNIIAPGRYSIG